MLSPGTLLPLAAPALPLDEAGKYVAGAYVVFLVLIVVYVAIMAAKLQRIERELKELAGFAESRAAIDRPTPGRGSDGSSISDSLTHQGSGGGGA
jgi:type II secretory pathway component PulM